MRTGRRLHRSDTSESERAVQQPPRPLGILAGAGPLPIEIAEAGARAGRRIHIVAIDGFAGDDVTRFPHERVSIGQLGRIIASFKRAGVSEMAIAGAIQRPNLGTLRIDWGFVRNLPTVIGLTRGGDDSVLRRVIHFFEGHGFDVIGAGDVAPDLLAPAGLIGSREPGEAAENAIARAAALIADLGRFDIGQGVVASAETIVAVEGIRGTDAMLGDLGPGGITEGCGDGAVLVKLAKPGQEMRIDLPTIGPETVRRAAAAGLTGIAVGAAGAIVLAREEVARVADNSALFVTGFHPRAAAEASPASLDVAPETATRDALEVVARRAPTPSEREDIALARSVLDVLAAHSAGNAVLVSRQHVLAINTHLALPEFVASQGRTRTWGRRALGRRRGVLVVEAHSSAGTAEAVLTVELFAAAKAVALAGLVVLSPLSRDDLRPDIIAWANEAGVFLMCSKVAS